MAHAPRLHSLQGFLRASSGFLSSDYGAVFCFRRRLLEIFLFRGISLLSAGGALFLLYRCGRRLGLSPLACAAGVWLLGLTPMFLLKMTEARPEAVAIFAFAGALSLTFAKSAESPETLSNRIRWKFIFIGILTGAMVLLSQKYVISATALLAAIYFLHGWKPTVIGASAFCTALAAYCCWMLAIGVGNEAFESVILMNLRWKYSFSSSGYFVELYTSSGILLVTGVFGIIRALFEGRTRRQAFGLAALLAGCILQILLVPVPYRQSFLPLLAIFALGTMLFSSYIFQLEALTRSGWAVFLIALLFGASSIAALPQQFSTNNNSDISQMRAIAKFAPSGSLFDGRGLMFYRMHVGYYACMHHEILMMLDADEYSASVIHELKEAGMPPLIRDYRVQKMPDRILSFITENYLASDISGLLVAGISKERLAPGKMEVLNVQTSGAWKASWRGGNIFIDGKTMLKGHSFFMEKGNRNLTTEGLVWDLRIERDYGGSEGWK